MNTLHINRRPIHNIGYWILCCCFSILTSACEKKISPDNNLSGDGLAQLGFRDGSLTVADVSSIGGWENSIAPTTTKAEPDELETLASGTTFRVIIYNSGENPKEAEPVAQNTYKVSESGKIYATAVDENGTAIEGDTTALLLRSGNYDFYYFSPAIPFDETSKSYMSLTHGVDYMAVLQHQTIDTKKGHFHCIPTVNFYRMASYIDIQIKPKDGEYLGSLEVIGDGVQIWGIPSLGTYELGGEPYSLATEGNAGVQDFTPEDFSLVDGQTATISTIQNGGHIILPGGVSGLRITASLKSDGTSMRMDATLGTQVFQPGYRYLIELGVSRIAPDPSINITIQQWNNTNWGNTDIGGKYPMVDGTIDPKPENISPLTKDFTVTLTSEASPWITPVKVRIWDGKQELATGTIAYNTDDKGGSTQLTLPDNPEEMRRDVWFQYQWYDNWYNIQLGQQKGSLVDVGATMLLEAKDPNYACTWEEAIQYCSEKGEGWRLPTSNELLFYWCITPALTSDEERFTPDRHYWSARKYENKSIVGFYTSNGQIHKNYAATSNEPGIGGTESREIMPTDKNYVRCVKPANRENSYPKFEIAEDGGVIVVLRDNNGGLDESTLFPNPLTQTLSGDEQSEDNRMSRRFRVQKTTNTQVTAKLQAVNLKNYCDTLTLDGYDNWRVPSQREMMLLFAIGASNYVQNGDADNTGVSSGQALVPTYLHQQEGMTPFETTSSYGGYIAATGVNIRKNEQRWTVYMGEYTSGASGYTQDTQTGFYTRCIRDEW